MRTEEGLKRELIFKEDGQEYGQVLKMLGNGRCDVSSFDENGEAIDRAGDCVPDSDEGAGMGFDDNAEAVHWLLRKTTGHCGGHRLTLRQTNFTIEHDNGTAVHRVLRKTTGHCGGHRLTAPSLPKLPSGQTK